MFLPAAHHLFCFRLIAAQTFGSWSFCCARYTSGISCWGLMAWIVMCASTYAKMRVIGRVRRCCVCVCGFCVRIACLCLYVWVRVLLLSSAPRILARPDHVSRRASKFVFGELLLYSGCQRNPLSALHPCFGSSVSSPFQFGEPSSFWNWYVITREYEELLQDNIALVAPLFIIANESAYKPRHDWTQINNPHFLNISIVPLEHGRTCSIRTEFEHPHRK